MEIWDLYDERGNKTGETWERARAKEIPEGRYHIVCDVLIRHRDGDFLLTFRDPSKDIYPGCWEASAGGSALAGETPEACARREMLEETGLKADALELIGVNYRPQSHSVLYAYLSVVDCRKDAVRLQEGETVDYRWLDLPAFLGLIGEEPILKKQYPRYKPYLDTLRVPGEENRRAEKAGIADIDALTKRRLDYLAEDSGPLAPGDEEALRNALPDYFREHLNKDLFGYVVREAGVIVSCAFLLTVTKPMSPAFINGKTATVLNVYTCPPFRRRGYARLVMDALTADAKARDIAVIQLKATEDGYALYRSAGFEDEHTKYRRMIWKARRDT